MATVKYNLGTVGGITKTVLYDGGRITSTGTYALSDSVYNYKLIIVEHVYGGDSNLHRQTNVIIDICNYNDAYIVCHGNSSYSFYCNFHFSVDGNNVIADTVNEEYIIKIVGIN